jgi:hypothetical protein
MKQILVLFICLLTATPAFAGWTTWQQEPDVVLFYDPDSVRVIGNQISVIFRETLTDPEQVVVTVPLNECLQSDQGGSGFNFIVEQATSKGWTATDTDTQYWNTESRYYRIAHWLCNKGVLRAPN